MDAGYPVNVRVKGSAEGGFKGEGQKRDKLDPHLPAVRTGAMCTEKCRGCNGVRATQKRSVGANAHPFGWGKHRVRLYAARTRRGAAPTPPAPKGEKKCNSERRTTSKICAAVNKKEPVRPKPFSSKSAIIRNCRLHQCYQREGVSAQTKNMCLK